MLRIIIVLVCVTIVRLEELKICKLAHAGGNLKFPDSFGFGVATAAYQIEGGWNEDDKGPSIWDTFTHQHPDLIADHANGDVGPDSYHKFDDDLKALQLLKVQHYRFSISWPRILPNGDKSSFNQKGIDYYNMVINKLLENNIQPMVTMFHYDLPEELSKIGGITNPLFIKYFDQYADVLFHHFGDRVKKWITFNEPFDYCNPGYGEGAFPPMVHAPGFADYLCMDHTLKAHGMAYARYKRQYQSQQGGKIGITISSRFFFSKANDTNLIDRALQFSLGWLAEPLYSDNTNYPAVMLHDIIVNSEKEGRVWPRLGPIDGYWETLLKHSADFLGLNYYTSRYVEAADPPQGEVPSWQYDAAMKFNIDGKWRRAKSTWLYCVPEGLEGLLKWIRDNYNNVEVVITENGWSDDGELNDIERMEYLKAHLQATLNAINGGCNVTGYTHWSLIDNFEWLQGYTEKFGLFRVDMNSTNKARVAKKSAYFYQKVIASRTIPIDTDLKDIFQL